MKNLKSLIGTILISFIMNATPVLSSQLFLEKTVYGPGEVVFVSGSLDFTTSCPTGGIPDGFPTIFPKARIYVIFDTGEDIQDGDVLIDVGAFNIAVGGGGGAFVLEPIATTFPAGNLHDGQYDIVIDECENGKFDAGVDLIIGRGAGFAFKVEGTSEYPILQLSQMKLDALSKADAYEKKCAKAVAGFKAIGVIGNATMFITPLYFSVGRLLGGVAVGFGGLITGLPTSPEGITSGLALSAFEINCAVIQARWQAIADDPPDPNFRNLVPLEPVRHLFPITNDAFEKSTLVVVNANDEQIALLGAFLSSLEKFQGSQQAGNGEFGFLQAREIKKYSDLLVNNFSKT